MHAYDAILSDYFMPDIDGISFLKQIRDYLPNIPFIIFTGQGDESVAIEALNSGADFYLKKGYDVTHRFSEIRQIIRILVTRAQSEENLINSEEKFRTIAEYAHEWLYWIDPEGTMLYVSPSCETITGYTARDFYQDPDLRTRIICEADRDRWRSHMEKCPEKKGTLSLDLRIRHKNGDIRWINHFCQSVFTSDNKYAGKRVGNLDITDRKKIESLLLSERNNFLKIFRAAPVGLLLLDKNTDITHANAAASALILREPADIIRKRGGGGLGCIHSLEDPRGCGYSSSCPDCPLRKGIEEVIARGISIHGEVIPLTLMIQGRPAVRWLNINAEPVEIEGKSSVIVAIDDITSQHDLEVALRESEEKFRVLSDSTTAGIMMFQDDHWIYANPAAEQISGYKMDELLSMPFWEVIHPDFREPLIRQGRARQQGDFKQKRHVSIKIIRKDGTERWIDVVAGTVFLGEKKAGLVTAIDITDQKLAEEKLAESEEKYRLIFENQIDLYYQASMDGIITNLSPSCKKMTGWDPEDLIGTPVSDLYVKPKDREGLIRHLLSDGVVYDFETELKNKAGIAVPVSINSHVIRGKDKKPVSIEGTLRDITARKEMEKALRKSEEHYRSLFDNMLEGFAYCEMIYDTDGKPVDWIYQNVNNSFERLTGLGDVTGKRVTEAIPGIKEQTPEIFDLYNKVVLSGIPMTFEIDFTPLHIWLRISVYRPEPGHFVAVFENITDRKTAEFALHTLIAQYQTILENVPAMIWYKDTKNTFIKINPAAARVFGKPAEEIEGRMFSEIFPGLKDRHFSEDLEVISTGTAKLGVMERLITAEGEHLWVQTDKVPLRDENGSILGILVVSTDITERKLVKDAVTLANKKLNLLSSITRHDIVNQLQGLFFSLDSAQEEDLLPPVRAHLERAEMFARNIERQIAFTSDYQDIGVRSPAWQDVGDTIRKAARTLDLGQIQLEVDVGTLQVFADPLLEKVFHNLIDNSNRYGEKITRIWFSGENRKTGFVIICSDDGVGIPEKYKEAIFRREYFKHTGFGLNLSREILGITGMTISETGTEGEGARFEIAVPREAYRFSDHHPQ